MNKNQKNYKGKILSIENIALDTYKAVISSELAYARPGQFISVLCPNKTLRRPFSIAGFDENNKTLLILFKLKGEGTQYLKDLKPDDTIDFIAPLGNGFELEENKKALLVGAGIGIAPMLYLKSELNKKNIENYLISGFKAKCEIISGSDENIVGGSVLDSLEDIIKKKNFEIIYACGPQIVLKKISEIALNNNISCYLALERVMACSIGVCRGCVIKLMKKNEVTYASVCKDGPVFEGSEIIWD